MEFVTFVVTTSLPSSCRVKLLIVQSSASTLFLCSPISCLLPELFHGVFFGFSLCFLLLYQNGLTLCFQPREQQWNPHRKYRSSQDIPTKSARAPRRGILLLQGRQPCRLRSSPVRRKSAVSFCKFKRSSTVCICGYTARNGTRFVLSVPLAHPLLFSCSICCDGCRGKGARTKTGCGTVRTRRPSWHRGPIIWSSKPKNPKQWYDVDLGRLSLFLWFAGFLLLLGNCIRVQECTAHN